MPTSFLVTYLYRHSTGSKNMATHKLAMCKTITELQLLVLSDHTVCSHLKENKHTLQHNVMFSLQMYMIKILVPQLSMTESAV